MSCVAYTCGLLLLAMTFMCPQTAHANDNAPASVKDLQYGEVLFHYYRKDYFKSIVRLNIAQQQKRLPNHQNEAELLLGGLNLSYGLRNSATDIFTQLLNDDRADNATHNRAWYHLARISYERGDTESALSALDKVKGRISDSNRAETIYLKSLLLLKQGRNVEAIKVMQSADTSKAWTPFLSYNLGIARIRTRELDEGAFLLEQIGQANASTGELRLLRDKANLALGFTYLKHGASLQSRQALDRVRLNGTLSNKALLGAGWADAEADAYSLALVPWMELGHRDAADPAVQEALLAIPYAMSKMSLHGQAVDHYNNAIDVLLKERYKLKQSIQAIRAGELLDALTTNNPGNDAGWLKEISGIKASPALRYQVQLMASYEFQEAVKNYRDVLDLQDNLDHWQGSMASYDDMLAARKLRYDQYRPAARKALDGKTLTAFRQQHANLHQNVLAIEAGNKPKGLANSTETGQLRRLSKLRNKLDQLPENPNTKKLRNKHRFLEGVLLWQISASYKPRLWKSKQDLSALESLISQSERAARSLQQADIDMPVGMSSFDLRANEMKQSISHLLKQSTITLKKQGKHIEDLAVTRLEEQKARLDSYLAQARFALAQIYDVALLQQAGAAQ